MKKARIILSLVLVMGSAAGIFAFKTRRHMAQIYYVCNTFYVTCTEAWTIGSWMTTLYDPDAIYTIYNANTASAVFNQNCMSNCTYSNTVWIEPGF
jgi:hypothetical protein